MNSIKNLVLNIIIIVLAVVFVASCGFAITELTDSFSGYRNRESSFVYAIEDHRIRSLIENYYENVSADGKEKEAFSEYYAMAKYCEAAFFYKSFQALGDEERIAKQRELMDAAVAQMGELAAAKKDYDMILGIE